MKCCTVTAVVVVVNLLRTIVVVVCPFDPPTPVVEKGRATVGHRVRFHLDFSLPVYIVHRRAANCFPSLNNNKRRLIPFEERQNERDKSRTEETHRFVGNFLIIIVINSQRISSRTTHTQSITTSPVPPETDRQTDGGGVIVSHPIASYQLRAEYSATENIERVALGP